MARALGFRLTPARILIGLFAVVLALGTAGLMMPVATAGAPNASFMEAFFTATSAVSVTGLVTVDTASYWSGFGHGVILVLAQFGGLGIVTLASLAGLVVSRRLGLRSRRLAQVESGLALGDVRRVIYSVLATAAVVETVVFAALTGAFWLHHDHELGRSLTLGLFHSISAFNNAGFTLFEGSLGDYVSDPLVCSVVAVAVLGGSIGFPVLLDVRSLSTRPARWSLHTKLTLSVTLVILLVSTVVLLAFEWTNPDTLGPHELPTKVLAAGFNSTMRTAGFSSFDWGAANHSTQLVTVLSMFVGGGSASAAGGIKVTTLALLVLAAVAEYRGDDDASAFGRRIPTAAIRQAIAVALTSTIVVLVGTLAILASGPFDLHDALFESTSAVGIVGLSTGLTDELGTGGQLIVIGLMVFGRLGPLTVGTALILRERERLYRFPEERPIVG